MSVNGESDELIQHWVLLLRTQVLIVLMSYCTYKCAGVQSSAFPFVMLHTIFLTVVHPTKTQLVSWIKGC